MVTGFDIISTNKALQDHWLRRFIALFIDGILISVIVWLISLFLHFGPFWWAFQGMMWWGIAILYFVVFELSMNASPGKRIMSLEVIATEGFLSVGSVFIRNVSKFLFLVVLDWLVGMFTEGDPRQKYTDRLAKTTVQRTDEKSYMEQQFKQMGYVPPKPTYHPQQGGPPSGTESGLEQPSAEPAKGPSETAWPHQEAPIKSDWPQHEPGKSAAEQVEAPRFCQYCGSTLTMGANGKGTCSRCGRVF